MVKARTLLLITSLAAAVSLGACTPDERELGQEDPGSAAPDLTSETSPPQVPPPPGDTTGIVDPPPVNP